MTGFDPESLLSILSPLGAAGRVWVAYSGGLDSTALLHAAAAVRERLPGPLWAVHLDHRLQPDSARWALHCETVGASLAIPCLVRTLEIVRAPGESLEAVAREARYRALAALLDPGDLVLAAHTQDDQAETLLLALIRGSGIHGLAAMPRVTGLGPGLLVRPLLEVRRTELEDYARRLGLTWVEDPTNAATSFDRNYLRNRVLPAMRDRWPAVALTLSRSAAHCAEAAALTDGVAGEALAGLTGERPGALSISGLQGLEPALCKAVLRLWLRRQGFALPDRAHLGRIVAEILPARPDAAPLVAWRGCEIRSYRRDLLALKPLPALPMESELRWEGRRLELPRGLGILERLADEPDHGAAGTALGTLVVRFGTPEQHCRPPRSAHRRSLKNLFQESGIPPWLRPYVPLVLDGETLLAVAGVCSCEPGAGGETPPAPRIRWSEHPWEGLGYFR